MRESLLSTRITRWARSLRYRRNVQRLKARALYEAWTTGPPPIFKLECPDIDLIKPIIDKLGPRGIISDLPVFDLGSPNPEDYVDDVSALAVHAFDFGRQFNKVETGNAFDCPLVFDTGASTGLTQFTCNVLD